MCIVRHCRDIRPDGSAIDFDRIRWCDKARLVQHACEDLEHGPPSYIRQLTGNDILDWELPYSRRRNSSSHHSKPRVTEISASSSRSVSPDDFPMEDFEPAVRPLSRLERRHTDYGELVPTKLERHHSRKHSNDSGGSGDRSRKRVLHLPFGFSITDLKPGKSRSHRRLNNDIVIVDKSRDGRRKDSKDSKEKLPYYSDRELDRELDRGRHRSRRDSDDWLYEHETRQLSEEYENDRKHHKEDYEKERARARAAYSGLPEKRRAAYASSSSSRQDSSSAIPSLRRSSTSADGVFASSKPTRYKSDAENDDDAFVLPTKPPRSRSPTTSPHNYEVKPLSASYSKKYSTHERPLVVDIGLKNRSSDYYEQEDERRARRKEYEHERVSSRRNPWASDTVELETASSNPRRRHGRLSDDRHDLKLRHGKRYIEDRDVNLSRRDQSLADIELSRQQRLKEENESRERRRREMAESLESKEPVASSKGYERLSRYAGAKVMATVAATAATAMSARDKYKKKEEEADSREKSASERLDRYEEARRSKADFLSSKYAGKDRDRDSFDESSAKKYTKKEPHESFFSRYGGRSADPFLPADYRDGAGGAKQHEAKMAAAAHKSADQKPKIFDLTERFDHLEREEHPSDLDEYAAGSSGNVAARAASANRERHRSSSPTKAGRYDKYASETDRADRADTLSAQAESRETLSRVRNARIERLEEMLAASRKDKDNDKTDDTFAKKAAAALYRKPSVEDLSDDDLNRRRSGTTGIPPSESHILSPVEKSKLPFVPKQKQTSPTRPSFGVDDDGPSRMTTAYLGKPAKTTDSASRDDGDIDDEDDDSSLTKSLRTANLRAKIQQMRTQQMRRSPSSESLRIEAALDPGMSTLRGVLKRTPSASKRKGVTFEV